jgi:DNA mismatch repair protein MutS2
MDERSAELLELPAVRERIAARAAFSGGRDLAVALTPSPDPAEVAVRVAETEEAILLRDLAVAGPGGAVDLRPLTREAERGAVLDPDELAAVLVTVRVALELREELAAHADDAPRLAERIRFISVPSMRRVESALERSLDPHGGLADTASPELALLRRRLAGARRAAADLLRTLAVRMRSHLQEGFTTERAGRPVLAVKASSRSAVPGIVHDSSGSGATIFVEPLPLIDANNQVRELAAQEAEEVARILRMLTALVAEERAHLDLAVGELAHLDLRMACGSVSREWDGCRVEPAAEADLRAARHPLLDPRGAVPVDLPLTGVRALVVSGPNTGGKTVALKTLGLCAMLHQCGLRIPAHSASLPVFDRVLADIGDDQSIAESLSTFSAHVRRLMAIMADAGPRSLVLLDEPAAGTDPDEGARLAQAVIARLVDDGALVLATTHHPEVKEWASAAPGAMNAAVAVDLRNLRPLYTLVMGEPGASHALGIAEGLGLDPAVVEAARSAGTPARRELESLLAEAASARAAAEDERLTARTAREEAERVRRAAEGERAELQRRLERSRADAAAAKEAARAEVERELASSTRELAELRREIAAARREEAARRRHADTAADTRARERDRRLGEASRRASAARRALDEAPAAGIAVPDGPPPEVGEAVIDSLTGLRGTIVAIRGGRAEVQGDTARMRVPLERLARDAAAPRAAARRPAPPPVPEGPPVAMDVDVRGRRAEATRDEVRRRVDAAAVAGVDLLRVIHGHGTGALRSVVREELGRHPLVSRIEPAPPEEGGDGATLAHIGG